MISQTSGPQHSVSQATGFTEDDFSKDGLEVGRLGLVQAHYIYCALYFYYYISPTLDYQALDPEGWGPLV